MYPHKLFVKKIFFFKINPYFGQKNNEIYVLQNNCLNNFKTYASKIGPLCGKINVTKYLKIGLRWTFGGRLKNKTQRNLSFIFLCNLKLRTHIQNTISTIRGVFIVQYDCWFLVVKSNEVSELWWKNLYKENNVN